MTFSEQLRADIALIEPALEVYLSRETHEGYDRIFEAAKYSAMAGGKRLRPVIVLEFCRLHGGDIKNALPPARAHNDLPCMDNDELRRGRPTCHKAFDEATAVLAGDGLLTAAFETASQADVPAETALRCIRILSENAGMNGMIGGQVFDMLAEHRRISETALRLLQKLKTGCLLRAACELGCAAAGKTDTERIAAARAYGDKLGLAFQIRDDMLDVIGDEATFGKPIGSDKAEKKTTFVDLLGLAACEREVVRLTDEAISALGLFGGEADFLAALSHSMETRNK